MSANVSNLEQILSHKSSNISTSLEALQYKKALEQLKTGIVNTVETYSDLPLFSENNGNMFYVKNEDVVYYANSFGWISITALNATSLFGWGWNNSGQLGVNNQIDYSSPVQEITSATNWCCVVTGYHSMGIKIDNSLYGWGTNNVGQLGVNCTNNKSTPTQEFTSSYDWVQVSVSSAATVALKSTGQLFSMGQNTEGLLAIDISTGITRSSPTQEFTSATDWCQVSICRYSSAALKTNNTLWVWGCNTVGQLGTNNIICYSSPVQEVTSATDWSKLSVGRETISAIKTNGTLWNWGINSGASGDGLLGTNDTINYSSPIQEVSSATNWCYVSGGGYHKLALKTDGTLWGWGVNIYGQIGTNNTICYSSPVQEVTSATDWCRVSAGERWQSRAIKTNGTLWGWGCNGSGELGDGATLPRSSPVQEITSATNWCQVSAGAQHTMAIKLLATF